MSSTSDKLTPHFSLSELTVTSTGLRNVPEAAHRANLQRTAERMEVVRALLGDRPLRVTSAYRSPTVNAAVGGVPNSDHAQGWAVDFIPGHMTALAAAEMIAATNLQFDQLILERNATLIHISFAPRQRRQVLRQPGGPGSPVYQGLR